MFLKYFIYEFKGIVKRNIRTPKVIREINQKKDFVKIVVGAGNHPVKGWYNFDIRSRSPNVYYLDVTKKFPLNDKSVNLVLCEHLIEHLSFDEGQHMLNEIYRVLKDTGRIRISTPDLARVISLYGNERGNGIAGEYIQWMSDFVPELKSRGRGSYQFIINNVFHNWGHQFLYDEELLSKCMEHIGYRSIRRYSLGKSDFDLFIGSEIHGQVVKNSEMVNFESLILEGSK
jgi:predicted SAM-dependent methyltransferase